ncbi:unnamed protein product [Lathyrus oleraceus]
MVHPIAEANVHSPFGTLTPDEFYARHSVTHHSEFVNNPRGLKLFTQWWIPQPPTNLIGTLAVIHGFTSESSWLIQLTSVYFAKAGFATCAIDHQGHGFSDGLVAHIPDNNPVVDDCTTFFESFRSRFNPSLPSFLYSESLGGAIALFISLRRTGLPWNGLVLNGAMCGISDSFKPPWPLEHFLSIAADYPDLARRSHTRLSSGRFVQGGVEEEACNCESEEHIGASTRLDGTGIVENLS